MLRTPPRDVHVHTCPAGGEWELNAYADAKSVVIQEITARAEQWAQITSWNPD